MSFTCPKCAKCMAEVVGGIDWAIELNKPSEPIYRSKCDDHCLSTEKKVNRGQHYIALNLWRHNKDLNRKMFPHPLTFPRVRKKIKEI